MRPTDSLLVKCSNSVKYLWYFLKYKVLLWFEALIFKDVKNLRDSLENTAKPTEPQIYFLLFMFSFIQQSTL